MKDYIKLAGTLCLITLAAALLLGGVNAITKDRIAAAAVETRNNAMQSLLPEAESFEEGENGIFKGVGPDGDAGYCVNVISSGFGGDISIMVGIKPDGTVAGIEILENSETAGLGANCTKDEFKKQFGGLEYPVTVVKGSANEGSVSAITGATITSNAVAGGVNSAYEILEESGITFKKGGR